MSAAAPAPPTDANLQKYKKLSPREHVLLRPDTYVGSTDKTECDRYVHDAGSKSIVRRNVTVSPALIKIFDELLVNARDHVIRCQEDKRENQVTRIDVTIDDAAGTITVRNNGEGIDVALHPNHKVWIPELIFAHLLTSTTYEDEGEQGSKGGRTIGGRNGLGAKLAYVFSTESQIETVDASRCKLYKQTFGPNLSSVSKPSVTQAKKKPYTQVTIKPDLARLGGDKIGFDHDTVAVMTRRIHDIAAVTDKSVQVRLNGEVLGVRSLEQYADMVLGSSRTAVPRVYECAGERWEYVAAVSRTGEFEQLSFVNGIYTRLGGSHVTHVANQICTRIAKKINKKDEAIKPAHIRSHLFLLLNCIVENPTFDSQTKEALTLPVAKFGSRAVVSDKFIDKICKLVKDRVTAVQGALAQAAGSKTDGRKTRRITNIPKLDDAEWAGGPKSGECTLLLTEGDSAKTGVISGLTAADRNSIGVFPLRGKFANVRGLGAGKLNTIAELTHLKQIIGLEFGRTYKPEDVGRLRYGRVRIVTDQDKDGSHIKGLIANAFEVLWPSLFAIPGFLSFMNTPILKARKGKGKNQQVAVFYSERDYHQWLQTPAARGNWEIKYYKGLGTSTGPEFKEYLANPKIVEFVRASPDPTQPDPALALAFTGGKVAAGRRKTWITGGSLNAADDQDRLYEGKLPVSAFVDGELRDFSVYDCDRSLPSVIDGLKTSQRKVLFSCFKRNLTKELKVAQLAGYVAEHSAYHHGEGSLHGTIINMAQTFTGSNNINLLYPAGQFGTKVQGGSDAASPRYIFTHLAPLARLVFPELDDAVHDYLQEDGERIEPQHYVPVIPMLLVNGCRGIGTGYSTNVPCYDVRQVIEAVRAHIRGDVRDGVTWVPAYRGFRGTVTVTEDGGKAHTKGVVARVKANIYRVTEVPVSMSYQDLTNKLSALCEGKRGEERVRDYKSYNTDKTCDFRVEFRADVVKSVDDAVSILGLEDSITLTNMHAFNAKGQIAKYAGPEGILEEFVPVRRAMYVKRKAHMIEVLTEKADWLNEQTLFIRAICDGKLVVSRRPDATVEKDIVGLGVRPEKVGDLLGMPIRSQTESKLAALEAKCEEAERELALVKKTTPDEMWLNDLNVLEKAIEAGLDMPEA